jgi:hypothetical protein
MISRSIASALVFSMASLATASATPPLGAAAEGSAAPSVTVADAAQRVAGEQASVDAEIGSLQAHAKDLVVGGAVSQVEADGVREQAVAYLRSPEVQALKKTLVRYNTSCTHRVLIGNQGYTCAIAHDKLKTFVTHHSQAMAEFQKRVDEQNNRTEQIKTEFVLTSNKIQDLQKYASWLELAREKIAKACGGPSPSAGSREEIERRCGQIRFDSLRADLPPCESERCPPWGRP